MNLILAITLLAACVAAANAKTCATAEDCSDEQCCVALTNNHLRNKGICKKLGKKGDRCNDHEAKIDYYGGKYITYCPCKEGFTCGNKAGFFASCPLNLQCSTAMRCVPTEQPVTTTKPEETDAPVVETDAPVEETDAPVEETDAPVVETDAPVEETDAPVVETDAPVEETDAPVEETDAPVEETDAPVEETDAPVVETDAPEPITEPEEEGGDGDEDNEGGEIVWGPGGEPPRDDDCADWELPC